MQNNAKKHPALADITGATMGRLPEITEEVLGVKYTMRLLKPEAEDFVATHTPGNTVSAALLNMRKPTIAAALVSITRRKDDGTEETLSMEQLFQPPDDMNLQARELLSQDARTMREWRREQILDWLREEVDSYRIDRLYDAYAKLWPKHRDAMQEAENFSKRTPSVA